MKNIKFKKIIVLLSLCSLTITQLTGCEGSTGNNSAPANSIQKTHPNLTSADLKNIQGVNDIDGVWTTMDGNDGSHFGSTVHILTDNNSSADVKFVGCQTLAGDETFTTKAADLPVGTAVKWTNKYDRSKWDELGKQNNGNIIAPIKEQTGNSHTSIQSNSDGTYANGQEHSTIACYYSAELPGTPKMYFKVQQDIGTYSTYSAIFQEVEKPMNDLKVSMDKSGEFWTSVGSSAFTGAAAGGIAYKISSYLQKLTPPDKAAFVERYLNGLLDSKHSAFIQFLEEFKAIKDKLSKEIIIYIVSSSDDSTDKNKAKNYQSEVKNYYLKPMTADDLKEIFSN
jgi:hypothetical protein